MLTQQITISLKPPRGMNWTQTMVNIPSHPPPLSIHFTEKMDPPGSGYKPPHLRQQDGSFSSSPNGSSWRGRGRGSHGFRGSSQQNNSGNRQRRNQNFQSRYGSETGSITTASEEELERRRKRFGADSADAKKGDMGYGLVSRGEDNRLQRDPVARKTFFRDVLKEVSAFHLVWCTGAIS